MTGEAQERRQDVARRSKGLGGRRRREEEEGARGGEGAGEAAGATVARRSLGSSFRIQWLSPRLPITRLHSPCILVSPSPLIR